MKKNISKVIVVTLILIVVAILAVYVAVEVIKNNQWFGREEVTQTANGGKVEMLADASAERKLLTAEEKKAFMEKLSKGWDGSIVKTIEVKIGGNNTNASESNDIGSEANGEAEKMKIPVPVGYTASEVEGENTVDGGFVIYEGDSPVTGESGSNEVKAAQKTRNQWVWVPIYDASEIYGVDSAGQMHGKLYDYSKNSESKRKPDNWSENDERVMTIKYTTSNREPDLVTYMDNDNDLGNYLAEENREELYKDMQENFKTTIESIKKYGGFYIGRYETGGLSGEVKIVKQNKDISYQTWYMMYEKSKQLGEENDSVETSMIWGCLWDATLQWLIDTGAVTYDDVGNDSSSWGNYKGEIFQYEDSNGDTQTTSKYYATIPTGSSDRNKKNNIYDMAGNVWDLTLEAYSGNNRNGRGGFYFLER